MPASSRAAELAAIADQLGQLGGKARGMRLPAEDWNAIVRILSRLVRVDVEQDEETGTRLDTAYARADHEHLSQVTLAWLAPDLQAIVGGGTDALPARQAIAELRRTLEALRTEVAGLSEIADRQQALIDRLVAADADRSNLLGGFDDRIAGIEDLRASVTGIATALNQIKPGIRQVTRLGERLTDESGAPIDLNALLGGVAEIRETGEKRTRELADRLAGLATRLAEVDALGADALDARLDELARNVRRQAEESAEELSRQLRDEVVGTLDGRLEELGNRVAEGAAASREAALAATGDLVSAAETRLAAGLADELATTRSTFLSTLQQQVGEAVSQGMAEADSRLSTRLDSRAEELKAELGGVLRSSLESRLDGAVAEAAGRLDSRISAAETKLAAAAEAIPQRIGQELEAAQTQLQARIEDRIDDRTMLLRQSLSAHFEEQLRSGLDAGLIRAREAAAQSAAATIGDLDARIAASVQSATQSLPGKIAGAVETKLAELDINGRIASATSQVAGQLRDEIATSAAEIQRSTTTQINSALAASRSGVLVTPQPNIPTGPGGIRFRGGGGGT